MSESTIKSPRFVPALGCLRPYQPSWLRGDLIAGITLAAYMMPASIGEASLAGLPPAAGLYTCLRSSTETVGGKSVIRKFIHFGVQGWTFDVSST